MLLVKNAIQILTREQRKRIVLADTPHTADYFLTTERYRKPKMSQTFTNEIFSVSVGNAKVLRVYKLGHSL